jgi:hypothetical protein
MEGLTRLVTESLARHGFDRPLDYRRLYWSRWFRCDSLHSLLFVPSKPGVFAVAEEIMDLGTTTAQVGTDAFVRPATLSEAKGSGPVEERPFRAAFSGQTSAALAAAAIADGQNRSEAVRRMLAVTQFFEDDDMAFVLDRMLSRDNPMRARLASGRYFVRFVVIEDPVQRRSICGALNQWMVSSVEKATGIGSHFASSLELTPQTEYVPPAHPDQTNLFDDAKTARTHMFASISNIALSKPAGAPAPTPATAPQLDSGAATNIHCPSPLPSGF